jgi:hypothetical protein
MKVLDTEIAIDATPEQVWDVLVDFEHYPEWNPFIVSMAGRPEVGTRLRGTLSPPGGRKLTLRPTVTAAVPGAVFEWWGHLGVRGVFDGRHRFELEATATGTRLRQRETFTGLLVPLAARSLDRHTTAGFLAMNEALKARVEARATTRRSG